MNTNGSIQLSFYIRSGMGKTDTLILSSSGLPKALLSFAIEQYKKHAPKILDRRGSHAGYVSVVPDNVVKCCLVQALTWTEKNVELTVWSDYVSIRFDAFWFGVDELFCDDRQRLISKTDFQTLNDDLNNYRRRGLVRLLPKPGKTEIRLLVPVYVQRQKKAFVFDDAPITTREEQVLRAVRDNPSASIGELSLILGISVKTIYRTLASLKKKGIEHLI